MFVRYNRVQDTIYFRPITIAFYYTQSYLRIINASTPARPTRSKLGANGVEAATARIRLSYTNYRMNTLTVRLMKVSVTTEFPRARYRVSARFSGRSGPLNRVCAAEVINRGQLNLTDRLRSSGFGNISFRRGLRTKPRS